MNNFFVAGITQVQKQKLQNSYISCYDFTLGEEHGIILEEGYLEAALSVLDAKVLSRSPSIYDGIELVVLDDRKLPGNMPAQQGATMKAEAGNWQGTNQASMVQIASAVLMPYIKRTVVVGNPRAVVSPLEDAHFYIHIYSSPAACLKGVTPPPTIWNIPVDCRDGAWPASGRGTSISDNGYAVAELVGNNLYVHHDLAKTGSVNEERLFVQILERALELLELKQSVLEMRNLFVDECGKAVSRAWAAAGNSPPDGSRIRQLSAELRQRIRAAQAEELRLLRNEQFNKETFGNEYMGLLGVKKVRDVTVENGSIVVYTDVLKARDDRSNLYHEIGAFKIVLNPAAKSPCWYNQTRTINGLKERQQAPHIWETGLACLGTAGPIFDQLFTERQWAIAAQLAIEFVESANTSDPAGKYVCNWPVTTAPSAQPAPTGQPATPTLDATHEAYRQAYIAACTDRVAEMVKQARESLVRERNEIESLQSQLVMELRASQVRKRKQAGQKFFDREKAAQEFDKLSQIPRVRGIRVEPGLLTVTTDALSGTDTSSGQEHQFGQMKIRFFLDGHADLIRWTNANGSRHAARQSQQAPLVLNSGRACLTDVRESFPDLIASFDFATAFEMAVDFIEQIDMEHPAGQTISCWPRRYDRQEPSSRAAEPSTEEAPVNAGIPSTPKTPKD